MRGVRAICYPIPMAFRIVSAATRRLAVAVVLACAALVLAPAAAGAQSWPSRPVKLIVGFAPGGVADVTARIVAEKLATLLGQPIIVDNRPSAGGIVAAEAVAKAEPDGYTLLLMTNGNAVSASLFRTLPYDTRADFAPVSTLGFFDVAMVASPQSQLATVAQVLAYAKANPGKLNIGTINTGSTQNLAAELFKSMTGVDATVVPYKGSPALVTALRSNDVQVAFEMLAPILPQAQAGAVKLIAVASEQRPTNLPDLPTVSESGVPGYTATSWNALAVPAKTPRAVVDRLQQAVVQALADPQVQRKLAAQGVTARASTPEELRRLLDADIGKWQRVIRDARIEPQ